MATGRRNDVREARVLSVSVSRRWSGSPSTVTRANRKDSSRSRNHHEGSNHGGIADYLACGLV